MHVFLRCVVRWWFMQVDHWKKDYKFGFGMTVGE